MLVDRCVAALITRLEIHRQNILWLVAPALNVGKVLSQLVGVRFCMRLILNHDGIRAI